MGKQVAKKVYRTADGTESRSANPDVVSLTFAFVNGSEIVVSLDEIGEKCRAAAAWHGIAQKIGDTYAGADTVEDAFESATGMLERLKLDEWTREREKGVVPINLIAQAITAARTKAGLVPDDEESQTAELARVADKLRENADLRKSALENPQVKAEHERLKAERAMERADKAAKAAEAAEGDGLDAI